MPMTLPSDFDLTGGAPPEFTSPLPDRADVVVIGAGVAGVNTAWHLAGQGLRVVLCEKGRVAAEQSSRNWGWIRVQGRDPAEIPLVLEARQHWRDWHELLGADLGYRVGGVTYLARSDREVASFEDWIEHARTHGLDTELLSRAALAEQFPGAAPGYWTGGMQTASDGRAEPFVAVPRMARAAATEQGVVIREACAARALDIQAGRVVGVITEAGRIAAEAVVLTGGAWSSLFLRAHGVSLPQLSVLSSVAATQPMPRFFDGAAVDDRVAFRRRADGGYTLAPGSSHVMHIGPDAFRHFRRFLPVLKDSWRTTTFKLAAPAGFPDAWRTPRRWSPDDVSPFETQRVLNPIPDAEALRDMAEGFAAAFPGMGKPAFRKTWAGMIDTMPDVVPVLDHVSPLPGLVLGTGLSGHGFGIGPAIGRVLADLVTGRPLGHDLSRFRWGRFSDGSGVTLGPSL